MEIHLGPVLYIGACDPDAWRFRAAVLTDVTDDAGPGLSLDFGEDADVATADRPVAVDSFPDVGDGLRYWAWDVEVERRAGADRWLSYRLRPEDGEEVAAAPHDDLAFDGVCVPRRGALPNIAFFSCNGVSEEKLYHEIPRPQRLWTNMRAKHERLRAGGERGYSLLIGGGDQVYADELWNDEPLREVRDLDHEDREDLDPADLTTTDDLAGDLTEQFVRLYARHWSRREMRDLFARVPGLYTWDDHEIMDGWGSRPSDLLGSPAYEQVFEVARRCFRTFQVGGADRSQRVGEGHFLQRLVFEEPGHELTVVVPDLRSGRTRERVLSEAQWGDLIRVLEAHAGGPRGSRRDGNGSGSGPAGGREGAGGPEGAGRGRGKRRHLLLVSSIPLVHLRFPFQGGLAGVPLDLFDLRDDLVDQWEHGNHRGERARLLMRLLDAAAEGGSRATVLSGDVHVGARARVVSEDPRHLPAPEGGDGGGRPRGPTRAVVHQVTASGIGHPPPDYWQWQGMRAVADDSPDRVGEHVTAAMASITSDRDYLRARNWLSARFDDPEEADERGETRLWCQWVYEEGDPEAGGTRPRELSEELVIPAR